jgi:hypothetical protein
MADAMSYLLPHAGILRRYAPAPRLCVLMTLRRMVTVAEEEAGLGCGRDAGAKTTLDALSYLTLKSRQATQNTL